MIGRLFALTIGLFSGLVASQAPEFAQQYRQRLGGAIDELRIIVARFDETARAAGMSRSDAITRFAQQSDPVVQGQAGLMGDLVDRLGRLERQRDDMAEAGPFGRMLAALRGADPVLARSTYLDFEPAWPATSEGLVAGGTGFAAAWIGLLLLLRTLRRLWPQRRARAVTGGLRSA